jgi:hypothetical protein
MDEFYRRTAPRILEYCGNERNPVWDCEFVVAGHGRDRRFRFSENAGLHRFLDSGSDVYRSLWSRRSTIFFLDLEYKNLRDMQEIYRNGPQIFREATEPVYQEVRSLLESLGISFITVMTATGYHFVFAIPSGTQVHARLESLGSPCPELLRQYARVPRVSHRGRAVPEASGRAFDGMGRLAEYLVKSLDPSTHVPVEAGIHHERQILLDLSTFADPLHIRFIRCVGSYHQKSPQHRFATLLRRPLFGPELGLPEAVGLQRDPGRAAPFIASIPAAIPDGGDAGFRELLSRYESSELYRRHQEFDAHRPNPREAERARGHLSQFADEELADDDGLKRAVVSGRSRGIHPRALGYLAAERYRLAQWSSPIMAWATEETEGYNPYSRALFWARFHAA